MSKRKRDNKELADLFEYYDTLSPEDQKWAMKFYYEYHLDWNVGKRLLRGDEMIKEARRNNNSLKRDAFNVARKTGELISTSQDLYGNDKELDYEKYDDYNNYKEFMEEASDEWEWRDAYALGGYEMACNTIFIQTMKGLHNLKETWEDSWPTLLARMYVKMEDLRRTRNNEIRNGSKNETT